MPIKLTDLFSSRRLEKYEELLRAAREKSSKERWHLYSEVGLLDDISASVLEDYRLVLRTEAFNSERTSFYSPAHFLKALVSYHRSVLQAHSSHVAVPGFKCRVVLSFERTGELFGSVEILSFEI